jgi:hypothetical protein
MRLITELKDIAKQKIKLILDDGTSADMKLYYSQRTQCWQFDLAYNEKVINGGQLVLGFNILDQWSNILPFGVTVFSEDNIDPFLLSDFVSDRIKMYILDKNDLLEVNNLIYGQ